MADLRGQQLKDSYQNVVTDSGSDLAGIENGNGADITGRIVERGSNSDGEWVRFADGTQICFHTSDPLDGITEESDISNLFQSGTLTPDFPQSFSNTPSQYCSSYKTSGGSVGSYAQFDVTTGESVALQTWNRARLYRIGSSTSDTSIAIYFAAIGRWK